MSRDHKQIVFVTSNPEKAKKFNENLERGIKLQQASLKLDEIQTVNKHELIEHKAKQAYEALKRPVLVEDVTLEFKAWGDLPGPFIKFFVDMGVSKLCRALDAFEDRTAIASCIFGCFDGNVLTTFIGKTEGKIANSPRGSNGYGFDRIFEPNGFGGKTAGELSDEQYQRYYRLVKPFQEFSRFLDSKNS